MLEVILNTRPEQFVSAEWFLAHALLLQMVPDKLIRVEFRRVARKKMQFEATLQRLNVLSNKASPMGWMSIEDQKRWVRTIAHEGLEKLQEPFLVESSGEDLEPKRAPTIHGRDGVD